MNNKQKQQGLIALLVAVVLYFLYKMFVKKSSYTSALGALSSRPGPTGGPMTYGQFMTGGDGTDGAGWLATPMGDGLRIYKLNRVIPMRLQSGTPSLEVPNSGIAMLNGDRLPITIENESNGPFRLTITKDGRIQQSGSSGVMGTI